MIAARHGGRYWSTTGAEVAARIATLNPKDFALVADEVEIVVPPRR